MKAVLSLVFILSSQGAFALSCVGVGSTGSFLEVTQGPPVAVTLNGRIAFSGTLKSSEPDVYGEEVYDLVEFGTGEAAVLTVTHMPVMGGGGGGFCRTRGPCRGGGGAVDLETSASLVIGTANALEFTCK